MQHAFLPNLFLTQFRQQTRRLSLRSSSVATIEKRQLLFTIKVVDCYLARRGYKRAVRRQRDTASEMFEEKVLVSVSSAASAIAVLVCLMVIPSLYSTINEVHGEVLDGVKEFRRETDAAWVDMLDVQVTVSPPSRPPANPFNSVFRQKRQTFSGLPAWCQCEPAKPKCPRGPPGPPGQPGQRGTPGLPGPRGQDNHQVHTAIDCPRQPTGCIKCPAGPAGPVGPSGPAGRPGPGGRPGEPGRKGSDGRPGQPGERGPAGQPGRDGTPGQPGHAGKDGRKGGGLPGPAGRPGQPGKQGARGEPGRNGEFGPDGTEGPAGSAGRPGERGADGRPGSPGNNGVPGGDAAYCACPKRSAVFVRNRN